MTSSSSARDSKGITYAAIALAVVAIAISIAAVAFATMQKQPAAPSTPTPESREFYLFTQVDEAVAAQEEELGVPPDLFSLKEMTVNKGDTVKVNFYNVEPIETQEHHTFTMAGPYEMNNDLNAGEHTTIEFTASEAGVFKYYCTFHVPTMTGQLIVLD